MKILKYIEIAGSFLNTSSMLVAVTHTIIMMLNISQAISINMLLLWSKH